MEAGVRRSSIARNQEWGQDAQWRERRGYQEGACLCPEASLEHLGQHSFSFLTEKMGQMVYLQNTLFLLIIS